MSEQIELPKIAMVITAHPDDAEFGSAGTVAFWASEGWDVYYVICTDGSGGGSDEATNVGKEAKHQMSVLRQHEQRNAAAVLGVKDVTFLNYPDGELEPTLALRRDIVRELRRRKPTRVIIPTPERSWAPSLAIGRYHPDHLAVGVAAMAALYPASQNPWDFPELLDEGFKPHKVKQIYITGAPLVNHFVDTTNFLDLKIKALRAHESQLGAHFEQVEERIRTWAKTSGEKYGVGVAEEFHYTENM